MALDCSTLIENGWFMEKNGQWPGQANSLEVKEVLLHEKTLFQDLMVFQSTTWGKVLVLDGVIQLTEKDEMSYQEMMCHLPMFAHSNPQQVMIVGGGDGGILREVVKHRCIEKVLHCEIDVGVINACKKFLPALAVGWADPRVEVVVDDAAAKIRSLPDSSMDVIIVDSSDPVGPAEGLFSSAFYAEMYRVLRPGGVVCCQGECLWVHQDLINQILSENAAPFASAEYASIQVPTYPSGQIGALLAQKAFPAGSLGDATCRKPRRAAEIAELTDLRYYSEGMHAAAFELPAFVQKSLKQRPPR